MKKSHLVGIIVIAIAVAVLISAAGQMSAYAGFRDAESQTGKKMQVVTTLQKDKETTYNPEKNPNYLAFYAKDKEWLTRRVIFKGAKPQGFERAEQLVLTGACIANGDFVADDMLMKCPSKYEKEQIEVKAAQVN